MLFSVTLTCQRLAVEPWAYLQDVLTRLPGLPAGSSTPCCGPLASGRAGARPASDQLAGCYVRWTDPSRPEQARHLEPLLPGEPGWQRAAGPARGPLSTRLAGRTRNVCSWSQMTKTSTPGVSSPVRERRQSKALLKKWASRPQSLDVDAAAILLWEFLTDETHILRRLKIGPATTKRSASKSGRSTRETWR